MVEDEVIDRILASATQDLRRRIKEAFEAGAEKVRRDLLTAMRQDDVTLDIALRGKSPADHGRMFGPRAHLGTVRPTIMRLIGKSKGGISPPEIITRTGFKVNSVRATLATLRKEGLIERSGELRVKRESPPERKLGVENH